MPRTTHSACHPNPTRAALTRRLPNAKKRNGTNVSLVVIVPSKSNAATIEQASREAGGATDLLSMIVISSTTATAPTGPRSSPCYSPPCGSRECTRSGDSDHALSLPTTTPAACLASRQFGRRSTGRRRPKPDLNVLQHTADFCLSVFSSASSTRTRRASCTPAGSPRFRSDNGCRRTRDCPPLPGRVARDSCTGA